MLAAKVATKPRLACPRGKDHPIPPPKPELRLPANLKISPAAVIDPDAALIKTPAAALPA